MLHDTTIAASGQHLDPDLMDCSLGMTVDLVPVLGHDRHMADAVEQNSGKTIDLRRRRLSSGHNTEVHKDSDRRVRPALILGRKRNLELGSNSCASPHKIDGAPFPCLKNVQAISPRVRDGPSPVPRGGLEGSSLVRFLGGGGRGGCPGVASDSDRVASLAIGYLIAGMEWRQRRQGQNEALFRALNENVEQFHTDTGGRLEFVCECSSPNCIEKVKATEAEYEAVRSKATTFLVARGHDDPAVEEVVEQVDRFLVVEKRGEAAEIAEQTDPRD
jgi:hypothetical protein